MSSAPGWYPDPWRPGQQRWWDGNGWTDHAIEPAAPPRPPAFVWQQGPPEPQRELDDERRSAVWAKRGFIALLAGRVIGGLASIVVLNNVIDEVRRSIDSNGKYQPDFRGVQLVSSPASALSILGLVLIVIWLQRAATVAQHLHYPAAHDPGWSIAGWFVPLVNFWFPYQCVRDCLPPGHRARNIVKQWWAAYLVGTALWMVTIIVALVSSYGVAVACALLAALVSSFELQRALHIVTAVEDDHADAVRRLAS